MWLKPELEQAYLRHRETASRLLEAGRLDEACDGFRAACAVADDGGSAAIVDRAFCNLAGVEIELGLAPDTIASRLRQMLVENRDAESCRLAAYHLGRFYDLRKQNKKALFYARIAQERSRQIDNTAWIASSSNQTALLLLSESRFDEASVELERALALLPAEEAMAAALVRDNLGYCRFLQGRSQEGFQLCLHSLRTLRRLGRQWWAAELTLTHGYLQIGRGRRALHHGRAALIGAEQGGDLQGVKNALFLLGEAASQAGDTDAAYDYFGRLQRDFYPDQHFLPDFLLAVDVTGLVNLKA
jgi:tetratricopeptide (TPR) repeat protein